MMRRWASLDDGADSDRQRERKRKKARFTEAPKVSSKPDQVRFFLVDPWLAGLGKLQCQEVL